MNKDSVCSERVFHSLHREHAVSVRNFLFYKLGNLEKAKDFTQESFVRLWNNCQKVMADKAKSYLFTVANRLFLDDYQHNKVKMKFQYRSQSTEVQMESNPEHIYREGEFKSLLENAIASLPEHQRTVFLMSRIDKLKNREVADTLGLSIKTVEKHISNALKSLRESVEELQNKKI